MCFTGVEVSNAEIRFAVDLTDISEVDGSTLALSCGRACAVFDRTSGSAGAVVVALATVAVAALDAAVDAVAVATMAVDVVAVVAAGAIVAVWGFIAPLVDIKLCAFETSGDLLFCCTNEIAGVSEQEESWSVLGKVAIRSFVKRSATAALSCKNTVILSGETFTSY